jgi:hypothetical protein
MFCDNAINADDVLEMYELVCSQGASRELKN